MSMNLFVTGPHPRLRYWGVDNEHGIRTRAELRARARDASGEYLPWFLKELFRAADADAADGPIPARREDADIGRACAGAWKRVKVAGIAWALTGDDKYFHTASRQVFAMCDQWRDWLDPFHAEFGWKSDLRTGRALWTIGLAYDEFYDRFTAQQRKHLADGMWERGFKLWLKDHNSLTNYGSNWCACVAGGVGIAAMATLEDIPESPHIAEMTCQHVPRMLEAFGADGGWPEGAGYWNGTGMLVEYLDVLRNATAGKLDYLSDERLRTTCWFPLYCCMAAGGIANFADGQYDWGPEALPYAAVAARLGDRRMQWGFHLAADRIKQGFVTTSGGDWGQFLIFYDPAVAASPPGDDIPRSRLFRDIGWVAIRNGWGDRDQEPVIICKAGNNTHGGCQHYDAGNLIANAFGERMLCDYGYGNGAPRWTWRMEPDENGMCRATDPLYSTVGHNVVAVAGRHQNWDSVSTVDAYHADEQIGVVARLNVTPAYQGVASAVRIVVHLRPDILAVLDDFQLQSAEQAWLSWHQPEVALPDNFPADGDMSKWLPAIEDGRFRRTAARGRMEAMCVSLTSGHVSYHSDAHRRIGMVDRAGVPMAPFVYPYVRTTAEPATRHLFLSVFAFLPANPGKAEPWQPTQNGAVLSRPGAHVAVVANPGATVADVTSGARLTVIDLTRRRAAASDNAPLRLPDGKDLHFGPTPFLAW